MIHKHWWKVSILDKKRSFAVLIFSFEILQEWETDSFWYWQEVLHGRTAGKEWGLPVHCQPGAEAAVLAACQQPGTSPSKLSFQHHKHSWWFSCQDCAVKIVIIAKLSPNPSSTQLGWVSYIITPEHPPHSLRNQATHHIACATQPPTRDSIKTTGWEAHIQQASLF